MKTYNIFITEDARNNLREIFSYISDYLLETSIAKKTQKSILTSIASLKNMPNRNPLINDEPYKSYKVRIHTAENYLIFYIVDESLSTVTVLNIIYNRRDWKNLVTTQ